MESEIPPSGHRRHPGSEDLRSSAVRRVEQLINLYEQTDPEGGETTAAGKDRRALAALLIASELVRQLSGWAVDHQVGLAGECRSFLSGTTEQHPEYVKTVEEVDDHRHELVGQKLWFSKEIPVVVQRQALLNLLFANVGALPIFLNFALRDALDALRFGDVAPILAPERRGRKVSFEEVKLQLAAIGFAEYRVHRGQTSSSAYERVGRAYGADAVTVRGWGARLNKDLGPLEVAHARSAAAQSGTNAEDALRRSYEGSTDTFALEHGENTYGDDALRTSGDRFKAVNKERKDRAT